MDGGPWFDLGHSPKSIGILAAPPAHHATLLGLVRSDRVGPHQSSSQRWGLAASRGRPHSSQKASHSARGAPSQRSSSGSVWRIGHAVVGGPEAGQVAVEHRLGPVVAQARRERRGARAADAGHLPGRGARRHVVEVAVARQHGRGRLGAPARDARDSRPTRRRPRPASPGSRAGRRPIWSGPRRRRRRGSGAGPTGRCARRGRAGPCPCRACRRGSSRPADRRRSGWRPRRSRRRPRTRPSATGRCRAPRRPLRRSGTGRAARAASRPTTCSRGTGRCGTTR